MSTYQTEEEQVEAIKRWWKANGKSVIGGVTLGLAVAGGIKYWQHYTEGKAESASNAYTRYLVTALKEDVEPALEMEKRLVSEHGDSAYAAFSALQAAKLLYRKGDTGAAILQLQLVIDKSPAKPLRELARLRMARLLVDQGQLDQAGKLISEADANFVAEYAELRGDIAVARKDNQAARIAYQDALENGVDSSELVRMKLADLGE